MNFQKPIVFYTPSSFRFRRVVRFSAGGSPDNGRKWAEHTSQIFSSIRDRWKLPADFNPDAIQQNMNSFMLKAKTLIEEVAVPLIKPTQNKTNKIEKKLEAVNDQEDVFFDTELTLDRKTPRGILSLDAVISIEQFGRLNGLTGQKMQKIFKSLAPENIKNDARSLVEYCCFRYLSKDGSEFHHNLKDLAFQRLIFITMLAWEQPYLTDNNLHRSLDKYSLKGRIVGEEAFMRIAPAVQGVADVATAHHLFKSLIGDQNGISFNLWTTYLSELSKVHEGRKTYQAGDNINSDESILCIGSSRKRPVLKWENNIAWPGNLTLTDKALYFEAIGLTGTKKSIRLDLTHENTRVEKSKVGPFNSKIFDSAVSVSSKSETWVLEFVDFGSETRRDAWHAFITEIISLYKFLYDFGPSDEDPTVHHVYGSHKGKKRAIKSMCNSIARIQSLQFIKKLNEDPLKLVQFSYLQRVSFGDVVLQTLALGFWGGPLITKFRVYDLEGNVSNLDGSVYLKRWMKNETWGASYSSAFWRGRKDGGVILGKNLVVGERSIIERASEICRERSKVVERTRATIVAATIEGIPSNIDLFKELMLPFVIIAERINELRRWEEPQSTTVFLIFSYTVIFKNLFRYVLPTILITISLTMLLLKSLKEQGRLGRSFGNVIIRDQAPSNTLQKIIGLKEAMASMENYLQHLNVALLKIRTILLAGQPEITTQVALVLMGGALTLLIFPFKYILSFLLMDFFTRELEFRREMVIKFRTLIKEKWESIDATPVSILPYENNILPNTGIVTKDLEKVVNSEKEKEGKDGNEIKVNLNNEKSLEI